MARGGGARRRSEEPPPLELGDGGVRWSREGATLRIRRGPNVRALVFPLGALAVAVFITVRSFGSGDRVIGGFMAFASLLAAAFVWMRIVHRAEIVVGPERITWRQEEPRGFEGSWERERVDGVRINVHPKGRWLEPRQAHVDLRVDGEWKMFLFSGPLGRAERLAEDLAFATGWIPGRIEAAT